jgi:TRAP-type C4-dicarboxylate transport system substrate-binding protein
VKKRSWGWRLVAIVAGVALAVGLVACGDDDDDAADTAGGGGAATTLNLAYVTTQQHPYGIAVDDFTEKVNATGELTVSPQASYPQSEIQLLDDVRSGVVDMGTISSAIWDTADINAFQALQAPFLITNYPLAQAVEGGEIGQAMIDQANEEAADLVVLAIHEGGLRKPFGIKRLAAPADFQGTTIRAPQSKVLSEGLSALGANVEPLPLPDVYQALQNGTVDGVEANLPLIYTSKWYEVAKYVTGNINFWPFPTVLAINKAKYDSLTDAQKAALTDAAATITDASIEIFTTPGSTVAQDLVNCGVEYVTASDASLAAFAQASEAAVSRLAPESQDFVAQIQAEKDALGPPAAPAPLPTTKTGACTPPAG